MVLSLSLTFSQPNNKELLWGCQPNNGMACLKPPPGLFDKSKQRTFPHTTSSSESIVDTFGADNRIHNSQSNFTQIPSK